MAISHLATRGYSNGSLTGSAVLVVLRGYAIGEVPIVLQVGILVSLQADIASLLSVDGQTVTLTTQTVTVPLLVHWEGISQSGGIQQGPLCYVALEDLPSDVEQGDTLLYDGTTYVVSYIERDGHGVVRLVFTDESKL